MTAWLELRCEDSRFLEALREALENIGADCEMDGRILRVLTAPAPAVLAGLRGKLKRVLVAYAAVSADLKEEPQDACRCGEDTSQLARDLAGHAVRHLGNVPHPVCIEYIASAACIPESLVRSMYGMRISRGSKGAWWSVVHELRRFLK